MLKHCISDYVPIGPRFSNLVLQALLVLLKKPPPQVSFCHQIFVTFQANCDFVTYTNFKRDFYNIFNNTGKNLFLKYQTDVNERSSFENFKEKRQSIPFCQFLEHADLTFKSNQQSYKSSKTKNQVDNNTIPMKIKITGIWVLSNFLTYKCLSVFRGRNSWLQERQVEKMFYVKWRWRLCFPRLFMCLTFLPVNI